jgi:hypothetical protein
MHEIDGFMYVPAFLPHFAQQVEFTDQIQFSAFPHYRLLKQRGSRPDNFYFYSGNIPGITWTAVSEETAQVWYSNIYMPVSLTPEVNRFKNYDGIFWNLGTEGTLTMEMPRLGKGNYDLYVENAVIPGTGGETYVYWGDNDSSRGWIIHRQENNPADNDELHSVRPNMGLNSDRSLRLIFQVRVMGNAGVDRAIISPR